MTFQPGSTRTCEPLRVIQDDVVEGDEFFTVTIVRADVTLGSIKTAQVEIQDSDSEFKESSYVKCTCQSYNYTNFVCG